MVHSLAFISIALVAVGVVVVPALALFSRRQRIHGFRLPPGPVPLPLVGNLLSIDPKRPWLTYTEWAMRYGDIFMIRLLNQDMVVINSEKIAKDLLDRRSRIYSNRPYSVTRDAYGLSFNFALAPYGDEWRWQRRIFHQVFRAASVLAFRPVQLRKARQLVLDMLSTPQDFSKHIKGFSTALIMSVVYDYEVARSRDRLVELFERGNTLVLESLTPQVSSIINTFPFVNVLNFPTWLPGSALSRAAAFCKRSVTQMTTEPFEHARKRKAMGSSVPAMALALLRGTEDDDISRLRLLKNTCATAFVAGAETTASTLECFMLAMLQHPEVQERAHAEIDAVVGTDRLPNFDDRPNLPYVEAIMMETLRLYAIAPLGLPHAATADDVYEDIFIPKGCTVVANIWAMHHNEDAYSQSDVFKPERFFTGGNLTEKKSIDSLAFGFGRRVCPGRYAADSSVWAAMVSILYAFRITKARGEQDEELEFEPTFRLGITLAPEPFPCSIIPRLPDVDIHKLSAVDSSEL